MELAFSSVNTLDELAPAPLARELEDRGYESLWVGGHSHIPVNQLTPYPAGEPERPYYRIQLDPLVALTAAAAVTTRLRLATGVLLVLERDLFTTANEIATVDQISGGRLLLGVGVGWNVEELANHQPGLPWQQRYAALREYVAALRALGTEEKAEYHGEYVDFDPVWSEPKPVQRPYPPVLPGVAGPIGIRHAAEWGDGWCPLDIGLGGLRRIERKLNGYREACAEAGRPAGEVTLMVWGEPEPDLIRRYRDLGVARAVLGAGLLGGPPDATLSYLDKYAGLVDELR
ncbi:MAG TPA: TIGR03619 family F420-dependent LLM class oxidoreductase [Mycobacteriales bacterium]|jgi:probable F420-dependent oxidoreductase|nr:TIGR03619 family F420-dependent LLM class oxidoreductase [Mycobacteriales bacterium]